MDSMSMLITRIELAARKCALNKKAEDFSFSQKTKLLSLIRSGLSSPANLAFEMCVKKSNLALLTKELIAEGLIEKHKGKSDGREVFFSLTKKGVKYLDSCLFSIEDACKTAFGSGYAEAVQKLSDALDVLELV